MAENEFEKQVQRKIEELKLNPSGEVWKNVEVQIRKEKKRRWLLLLLLFLFIFSSGIFWWKENQPTGIVLLKSSAGNAPVITNDKKEINYPEVKSKDINNQKSAQPETILSNNNYNSKRFVYMKKSDAKFGVKQNMGESDRNNGHEITMRSKPKMKASIVTADANDLVDNNEIGQKPLNDSANEKNIFFDSLKKEQDKNIVVDSNNKTKVETTININKATDTSVKKNEIKKHKWNFAVQLGVGISATGSSYLSSGNGSLPGNNTGFGGTVSGSGHYSPAQAKMSLAFKLGLSVVYHISKKISVSAGLTYKLYSTVISIGTKIIDSNNTSANLYFGGTNNLYHNYYHFIDVPFEFQYRIGNNAQFPVYAFGGLTLSNLIYTNALQYDYTKGIYYHDNSLFNKMSVGITGGFLFDMFQKKKIPLQIGPDFYYGLSNIASSGLYNDKHYSYVGLRFQKIIGSK